MYLYRFVIAGFLIVSASTLNAQPKEETTDIKRIWDRGGHNAYTDINFLKGKLFVVLREANAEKPENNSDHGIIRILTSLDGEFWESLTTLQVPNIDLREPTLSITPKNRLMLLMKGVQYEGDETKQIATYVSMSDPNGTRFSDPEPLELEAPLQSSFSYLGRMTWYDKTGYSVFTKLNEGSTNEVYLVKNEKKTDLEVVTKLDIDGNPNQGVVRFLGGAEMMIMLETDDNTGLMGTSKAPFSEWSWEKLDIPLEGMNFEIIPINKVLLGATNTTENGNTCVLYQGKKNEAFTESFQLPSGGDTGHMGMFAIAGFVWLSYHSSHEGKTSVYYARIPISKLK